MQKFLNVSAFAIIASLVAQAQDASPMNTSETTTMLTDVRVMEVVRISGLRPEPLTESTSSVIVLRDDALQPADTLRRSPGVSVSRSGGPGALTQVRIRGAEANHTLVLLDGFEVSDPVTGETDFGLLAALPASRIEVLRGAASSIHGSDAIGGVVSIGAQDLSADEAGWLRGEIETGSFDTTRGALSLGGGEQTYVSGALTGFTTSGVDTSGLEDETDGADALSGLLRVNSSGFSGLLLARTTRSAFDPDADFDGRLENGDRETEAQQILAGVAYENQIGAFDHRLSASLNRVTREGFADGALEDETEGDRFKASYSPSWSRDARRITGLVEIERETYTRADVSFGGATNTDEAFESRALALQYKEQFFIFDVDASVRQDFNSGRFDDAFTWRLGGAVKVFTDEKLRLRGGLARGVKNPTFTELFGFFPGSFIGNSSLVPETSFGGDLGLERNAADYTWSITYFKAAL